MTGFIRFRQEPTGTWQSRQPYTVTGFLRRVPDIFRRVPAENSRNTASEIIELRWDGVGLILGTTLHIKPTSDDDDDDSSKCKIKCSLYFNIKSSDFYLPHIRFSLNQESMQILSERKEIPFSDADKEVLINTFQFLNQFEKKFPLIINKQKRTQDK